MKNCILFRDSLTEEDEIIAANKHFRVFTQRSEIPHSNVVVGRYSVLPYYGELFKDLSHSGSRLVNTIREHTNVADLKNWYYLLEDFTFKTWFSLYEFKRDAPEGSFVLKGATNSKKEQWFTEMFAPIKESVDRVYSSLSKDSLIGSQDIYIRKYEPLRRLGTKVDGRPITEEYRYFCYKNKILASGFYWSEDYDYLVDEGILSTWMTPSYIDSFVKNYISRDIKDFCKFYVVDVAVTVGGSLKVVELNDGQMSGLSMCDPDELYFNLSVSLNNDIWVE